MLRIYYLHHSSALVELEECYLLFDYFKAKDLYGYSFHGVLPELDEQKHLYIFASHSHKDHFDIEVIREFMDRPNTTFILSKDIRLGRKYLAEHGIGEEVKSRINFVKALQHYDFGPLRVDTLRSTDAGVAFLVEAYGYTIYHAGDLHWWNAGERGELYSEKYGKEYKAALRHISNRHMDLAFVVLDPRLKDGTNFGMKYFLEHMDVDMVLPIHMWQDYSCVERIKRDPELVRLSDKILTVDRENIIFELEE